MSYNVFQPLPEYYKESTAAQLLRPRVDDLVREGGLDYKELNERIVAANRTEGIPVDHNPVYGGLSKEVCAVERQESFTIDDKLNSFDGKVYNLLPRKVFLKTSDTSVVSSATGFWGDELTIKVNALLNSLSTKAVSLLGLPVEGVFELDKVRLIVDESIKNPWKIDFSDEDNILLTVNPFKQNVIPLIFRPSDEKLNGSFVNVSLLILDERDKAVIPEIKEGVYVTVAELNSTNSTSFKDKKGKTKTVISGTIVGDILNSETKNVLSSVTCDVLVDNVFPELPTTYVGNGVDDVTKRLNTLFANVVIKQSSIRDLKVILPIRYLADDRDELKAITSLTIEQTVPLHLTYINSGFTFRGDPCVVDSSAVSSLLNIDAQNADGDVTLTVGNVVVDGALNKDQKSTKAKVTLTNEDGLISALTSNVEIEDDRPYKAKENYKATENFAVEITNDAWNAGAKGQAWIGDSLTITGSLTKVENQFGRTILPADILLQSFKPIDVNERILDVSDSNLIEIVASDDPSGSTIAKATLYLLLTDLSVISVPVEIDVTDSRS